MINDEELILCSSIRLRKAILYAGYRHRLICLNTGKLAAILKQGAKDAGLPYISIHCFRHSHITNLIAEGYSPVDIAKRVGHESIYITLHYSHAFKDVEGDIAQSLDREMNKAMEAEKPDAETR